MECLHLRRSFLSLWKIPSVEQRVSVLVYLPQGEELLGTGGQSLKDLLPSGKGFRRRSANECDSSYKDKV